MSIARSMWMCGRNGDAGMFLMGVGMLQNKIKYPENKLRGRNMRSE